MLGAILCFIVGGAPEPSQRLSDERFRVVATQWLREVVLIPGLACLEPGDLERGSYVIKLNRLGQVQAKVTGSARLQKCFLSVALPFQDFVATELAVEVSGLLGGHPTDELPDHAMVDAFIPRESKPRGVACENDRSCGGGQACFNDGDTGNKCFDVRSLLSQWAYEPEKIFNVSLVQLLVQPERFQGKRVRLIGYAAFEFEQSAVFLHKEDSDVFNTSNALWIQAGLPTPVGHYWILVEGVFDSTVTGHLGAYPGGLRDVTRLVRWKQGKR